MSNKCHDWDTALGYGDAYRGLFDPGRYAESPGYRSGFESALLDRTCPGIDSLERFTDGRGAKYLEQLKARSQALHMSPLPPAVKAQVLDQKEHIACPRCGSPASDSLFHSPKISHIVRPLLFRVAGLPFEAPKLERHYHVHVCRSCSYEVLGPTGTGEAVTMLGGLARVQRPRTFQTPQQKWQPERGLTCPACGTKSSLHDTGETCILCRLGAYRETKVDSDGDLRQGNTMMANEIRAAYFQCGACGSQVVQFITGEWPEEKPGQHACPSTCWQ